jgi:hypothetical protein
MLKTILLSLLIFLWVYAAVAKLTVYTHFSLQLMRMPWLGNFHNVLAWLVPVIELVTAGYLIVPYTRKAGLIGSAALLFLFSLYIFILLLRKASLPCACGGIISAMSWKQHLFFNAFFLVMNVYLLQSGTKNITASARSSKQEIAENL